MSDTIRTARANVAGDIARSRRRISELSAQLRAESTQLANLQAIAEIVGVTAVEAEDFSNVVVDASVSPSAMTGMAASIGSANGRVLRLETEAPPAVGTPMGP
ncbi:MAG: hypothetical protein WC700_02010 [Gemmatimonadaceae bacterium]|jgi:hypothetical protein